MGLYNKNYRLALILVISTLILSACSVSTVPTGSVPQPLKTPSTAPTSTPIVTDGIDDSLGVVEYNLGEAVILQERFPEDSRFRNMPVRLNGLIAVPSGEGGPFPVVVILHGNHHGCPVDEMGVDRWPCDPEVEQPNYRGFEYLVRELADSGYVALSLNINAENTLGFGEPVPGERLGQVFDLHMRALAAAAGGGENAFGVDLSGRADLQHVVLMGHSRGGEESLRLTRQLQQEDVIAAGLPYGPVEGVILIAASAQALETAGGSPVPMAIVLPTCDGDVISQDGQHFFEAARLTPQQTNWIISVWLERGNHNFFNLLLPEDPFRSADRPECVQVLEPEVQSAFLVDLTADFLTTIWNQDPGLVSEAAKRMDLDVSLPVLNEFYGLPGRAAFMAPADDRLSLLLPAKEDHLVTNLAGGTITEDGVTTNFCPEGFYTPEMLPGSEPCRRVTVTIPGQPALVVVTWPELGGEWKFALPAGEGDLSGYTTFTLRAAVDPLSSLNPEGIPQSFSLRLTDRAGNTATVPTRIDEPALVFPAGVVQDDSFFGSLFTSPVPMTSIRWALSEFAGVDLTEISEVALIFDQTPSGTLFINDLEWVRPSRP